MSYSGRKINYTLRPAKNVERKMICEYLRNAGKAFDISEYRYLGFGASYFSDYSDSRVIPILSQKSLSANLY